MLSMKWTGTMCLTEPQAGSSLSDIVTTAKDNGDGTYIFVGKKSLSLREIINILRTSFI